MMQTNLKNQEACPVRISNGRRPGIGHLYWENSNGGFIALISIIIIMAILLVITFTLSTGGFFLRFNVLDSESKKTSLGLADACVQQAMLDLATGPGTFPKTVSVGSNTCKICNIQTSGSQKTIQTRAVNVDGGSRSYSNVTAVVNQDAYNNFTITSWDDLAANPNPSCTVP